MKTLLQGSYRPRLPCFRLKNTSAVTSGLTMQLVPSDPQEPTTDDSVWIDEEPFSYLEGCIMTCWPAYVHYGHWGDTVIPTSAWRDVARLWRELRASLLSATTPDDVSGISFLFSSSRARFNRTFHHVSPALAGLLNDLLVWLEPRCFSCSAIMVRGI